MLHHGTIRNYTAALLDLFNNLEIQYTDSVGGVKTRSIPVVYSGREKSALLVGLTADQLKTGNYNVLPRAGLSMSSITKAESRLLNKSNKINQVSKQNTFDFTYNSVPFEFTFELTVLCRGMNEATQLVEQVAPMFNPIVELDVWESSNMSTPTRIPVKLLDVSIDQEDFDEYSSNLTTCTFGISINGNLYPPIKTTDRIKQFKMSISEAYGTPGVPVQPRTGAYAPIDTYARRVIENFDVPSTGTPGTNTTVTVSNVSQYPPTIVDIQSVSPVVLGTNNVVLIYTDPDNRTSEMTFVWTIIQGNATVTTGTPGDTAVVDVLSAGTIELHAQVTDPFGLTATISKIYTV